MEDQEKGVQATGSAPNASAPIEDSPQYEVVTTAQVERTYLVQAKSVEQAHARLRAWLKDPDMLGPGIVRLDDPKQRDTTEQRVKSINGNAVRPDAAQKNGAEQTPKRTRGRQGAAS